MTEELSQIEGGWGEITTNNLEPSTETLER